MSESDSKASGSKYPDPPSYRDVPPSSLTTSLENLIRANHILHYHHVFDAHSHVSVRHPHNLETFIMSGSSVPALVSSPSELVTYNISDAKPVDISAKKGDDFHHERFIHSEIYKRFGDVHCIVHSHSEAVLPFTMNGIDMKPCFHNAAFLGTRVSVYDINPSYSSLDTQDLFVSHQSFGRSLASCFSSPPSKTLFKKNRPPTPQNPLPDYAVVLMANHGFTAVGPSIQDAVYRAVYTHINAKVQLNALTLRGAAIESGEIVGGFKYLSKEAIKSAKEDYHSDWKLWVKETEACPLYKRSF